MSQELSDLAARLRQSMLSQGRVPRGPDSKGENGGSYNPPRQEFDSFALELFALQFKYNGAYRTICQARGLTPDVVEHWTRIPAVPTTAFKELELSCIPSKARTAVFHSSGTTERKPSRHFHSAESLHIYETALWQWFQRNVQSDLRFTICDSRWICLTPPPEQAPHSSLVHMFETARSRACENADHPFFGAVAADGSWVLDSDAVLTALSPGLKTPDPRPCLLLGTAFSFVHLLDFLGQRDLRLQLPTGSRVMETGGYKNRSRALPKEELHTLVAEWLGIPTENILCEYGMSELSSQAYDHVAGDEWQVTGNAVSRHPSPVTRRFRFPPWARAQIISPETGREVAEGETGLIRVFDLANVFSVMAVQTEDLGVRRGDGFELIGRAQLAEPRGCSLASA
ncbi:MAG TPA: hypothetical protein VMA35_12525 [Candidatus Sulfopaludibacter sp.]|nr:hypothetical protein [Candidatus Sulfopaludibacter sp.]